MTHGAGGRLPSTVTEATDRVLSELSEEDKEKIRSTPRASLFQLHFGLGTFVRNSCGLWPATTSLRRRARRQGNVLLRRI